MLESLQIRVANPADREYVLAFLQRENYKQAVPEQDHVFLAEHSGELVGVVRLAREHETLVLRGMRVHSRLQRQGIGRRLLEILEREIGDERCYCIPFRWLVGFYGEIGFQEIEVTDVPPFLAQRCAGYLKKGQNVVVMRREGRTMR